MPELINAKITFDLVVNYKKVKNDYSFTFKGLGLLE